MRSKNHRFPNTDTICENVDSGFRVVTSGHKRSRSMNKKETEEAIADSLTVTVSPVRLHDG